MLATFGMHKSVVSGVLVGGVAALLAFACSPMGGGDDSSGGAGATSGGTGTGATSSIGGSPSGGAGGDGGAPEAGSCGASLGAEAESVGFSVGAVVYTYGDQGGSCIAGSAADGVACIHGTTAPTGPGLYDSIWGAGLGIDLSSPAHAYDLSAFAGFRFVISGTLPAALRVGIALEGNTDAFFTEKIVSGMNEAIFEDLAQGTWVEGENRVDFDASKVSTLQFQVPALDNESLEFDFCVGEVSLVAAGGAGGAGGAGDSL